VLFEVNRSRDFETSLITDGCRFCNIKETDINNNKYIIHVGSHFSLGSTAQPKLFVISRILVDFFTLGDNWASTIICRFSPSIRIFSDCSLSD